VVKDKMKDNYGRPFFVCADRHATFGNGETFMKALDYAASTGWYAPYVK
jgi:hypothetical protein